jgi:hypothetical protein
MMLSDPITTPLDVLDDKILISMHELLYTFGIPTPAKS